MTNREVFTKIFNNPTFEHAHCENCNVLVPCASCDWWGKEYTDSEEKKSPFKVFISQPMKDRTDEEIMQERNKIISAKSKEDKWIIDGNYNKTLKERLDPTFVKYVLTYNKNKRHIILEHLQNIPNEKVLIFRHQKDLNNWLKTFTNNPNILYCYILL